MWRQILKQNFTKVDSLIAFLEFSQENVKKVLERPRFPLNLPLRLAEKMAKNDLDDPIFKQFVPIFEETLEYPNFVDDPVRDVSFQKEKKMLQKYEGRVLLVTTGACAMNCRFCFRQNFPYEKFRYGFEEELKKIEEDASIHEVILSGGDPLSLSNASLEKLFLKLERIPHIKRIRIHSRFLIGIPERMDEELFSICKATKKPIYFVLHVNHPKEIDEEVKVALNRLKEAKVILLNQSVLLKGVNDSKELFLSLCETLINVGVIPYYLHLLDPVRGTGHFFVEEEEAISLLNYLREHISGFGVPRLVREEPGKKSKTHILKCVNEPNC